VRARLSKPPELVIHADDTHSYCVNSTCKIWDAFDIVYPKADSDAISITTRVVEIEQERICKEEDIKCSDIFQETGKNKFFIADVENFLLVIDHSMQTSNFIKRKMDFDEIAKSSRDMNGTLLSYNNSVVHELPKFKPDIIPLWKLLESADVFLDDKSDRIRWRRTRRRVQQDFIVQNEVEEQSLGIERWGGEEDRSFRARGLVLFVTIHYTNMDTWFGIENTVHYEYRVHRLQETEYALYESLDSTEGDMHRHLHKRFCIHIKFLLSGSIGRFSLNALLSNIVTSLGLVTLASIIVDQLALYVLPIRQQYNNVKYGKRDRVVANTNSKVKQKEM